MRYALNGAPLTRRLLVRKRLFSSPVDPIGFPLSSSPREDNDGCDGTLPVEDLRRRADCPIVAPDMYPVVSTDALVWSGASLMLPRRFRSGFRLRTHSTRRRPACQPPHKHPPNRRFQAVSGPFRCHKRRQTRIRPAGRALLHEPPALAGCACWLDARVSRLCALAGHTRYQDAHALYHRRMRIIAY